VPAGPSSFVESAALGRNRGASRLSLLYNFDITPAVRSVTNFVNRAINTVESWF
jgi:hypothetical protein